MTLDELKILEELIQFARGKVFTDSVMDIIIKADTIIQREIRLKTINFITMTDVNGNSIEGGD